MRTSFAACVLVSLCAGVGCPSGEARQGTVEADLDARVDTDLDATVEARAGTIEASAATGDSAIKVTTSQPAIASGENSIAAPTTNTTDTDQSGMFNTAITVAGGTGLAGLLTLGLWLRHSSKAAAAADAEETKRHQQIIDGMKCAARDQTSGIIVPRCEPTETTETTQ